ncbi:MAG: mRNA surveillance protein pelota [Candidatus Aenigmatarchaeota archaeon]
MKSSFDLKHNLAKVTPESQEDLEILKEVITPEALITAKSPRSIKIKREGELIRAKTGRKEVILKIKVEKIELKEKLRLTGKIIEAPEDVEKGYHTIEIEPNKFLKIEKKWKGWEIDRVKSAERKVEPILICILDESEADFYLLKERYKFLLHIDSEVSGKRYDTKKAEEKQKEYFQKILEVLKTKQANKIIIAGPAFAKDNVLRLVREREKELLEKIIVEQTFQIGELGLQELLKKGLVERISKMNRAAEEARTVENLLEAINKEKAVFGENVKYALQSGLISLVLVSDIKIRDFEEILDLADKFKVKIMVISSKSNAGEKLLGLGGIAGLLY